MVASTEDVCVYMRDSTHICECVCRMWIPIDWIWTINSEGQSVPYSIHFNKCLVTSFKKIHIYIYLFLTDWWLLYNIGLISAIHQCELTMGVLISPPSWTFLSPPTFPTPLVVTEPWSEIPESYSKFPLSIYFTYDSVYVSMLLSPFISPSLSSPQPWSISRLSISASPLLSCE